MSDVFGAWLFILGLVPGMPICFWIPFPTPCYCMHVVVCFFGTATLFFFFGSHSALLPLHSSPLPTIAPTWQAMKLMHNNTLNFLINKT